MKLIEEKLGFSLVPVLLGIVVVGVISLVGFNVYSTQKAHKVAQNYDQPTTSQSAKAEDVPEAPEIKTTEDLNKADQALDSAEVESSNDTAQLDAEIAQF